MVWRTPARRKEEVLMAKITMIGSELAQEGLEFTFLGPNMDCRGCAFKQACLQLERGHRYRVLKTREKQHDCLIHDSGKVNVVEIEELGLSLNLPKELVVKGSTVKFDHVDCPYASCPHRSGCFPPGLEAPVKVQIDEIPDPNLECALGRKLSRSLVHIYG